MKKVNKKVVEYYSFYCPGCKHEHMYTVSAESYHWQFNGNLESPSFTPSLLNSMKLQNEVTGVYDVEKERCHLFVTDGKIIFCGDCSHELSGQTVEMREINI